MLPNPSSPPVEYFPLTPSPGRAYPNQLQWSPPPQHRLATPVRPRIWSLCLAGAKCSGFSGQARDGEGRGE